MKQKANLIKPKKFKFVLNQTYTHKDQSKIAMRSIVSLIRSLFNSKPSAYQGISNEPTHSANVRSLSAATEIFQDHIHPPFNYSHLSPKQAQRLLLKRKKEDGFIDHSTYAGLMDALHVNQNETINSELHQLNDEELKNWYTLKKKAKQWVTYSVAQYISSRLKPAHESLLIHQMNGVGKNKIKKWVDEKRKSGYFFSDKAYQKAIEIYLGK